MPYLYVTDCLPAGLPAVISSYELFRQLQIGLFKWLNFIFFWDEILSMHNLWKMLMKHRHQKAVKWMPVALKKLLLLSPMKSQWQHVYVIVTFMKAMATTPTVSLLLNASRDIISASTTICSTQTYASLLQTLILFKWTQTSALFVNFSLKLQLYLCKTPSSTHKWICVINLHCYCCNKYYQHSVNNIFLAG